MLLPIPSTASRVGGWSRNQLFCALRGHRNSSLQSVTSCSGLHPTLSVELLCLLLTSDTTSRHLSITVASSTVSDLPGYCALTFSLMPAASTSTLSGQGLDFEDICLLVQRDRLVCDSCSSGQCFACGFLQIPFRNGHPCRPANDSSCQARK